MAQFDRDIFRITIAFSKLIRPLFEKNENRNSGFQRKNIEAKKRLSLKEKTIPLCSACVSRFSFTVIPHNTNSRRLPLHSQSFMEPSNSFSLSNDKAKPRQHQIQKQMSDKNQQVTRAKKQSSHS
jgi:hypothetical protein